MMIISQLFCILAELATWVVESGAAFYFNAWQPLYMLTFIHVENTTQIQMESFKTTSATYPTVHSF